jgi:uncharacterized membrane protein YdjX (TVP38/TMEM64 family)
MRLTIIFSTVLIIFLISFLIVDSMNIPILTDPSFLKESGSIATALGSIALLALDIILPIPSSLVMIANGTLFGAPVGFGISMIGGIIASMTGFFLGRSSSPWISKIASPSELAKAEELMHKFGMVAIIVTRPVPLLSETMAIIAGTSSITTTQMIFASIAGLFPAALIYALTGAYALTLDSGLYSFILVIVVAGLFWLTGHLFQRRKTLNSSGNLKIK